MIPGLNLFAIAGGVIKQQTVQYRQWLTRSLTVAGEFVDGYADAVDIQGSWQPVDTKRIAQLGLDMKQEYRCLWTSTHIRGIDADPARGNDQIIADGKTWEPTHTSNDWQSVDGWQDYILVRVS